MKAKIVIGKEAQIAFTVNVHFQYVAIFDPTMIFAIVAQFFGNIEQIELKISVIEYQISIKVVIVYSEQKWWYFVNYKSYHVADREDAFSIQQK